MVGGPGTYLVQWSPCPGSSRAPGSRKTSEDPGSLQGGGGQVWGVGEECHYGQMGCCT